MRAALNGESSLGLARRMERDFFDDMRALNVRPPITYLRVTEHIPEIIAYIQRIIDNGFAYVDNGKCPFKSPRANATVSTQVMCISIRLHLVVVMSSIN